MERKTFNVEIAALGRPVSIGQLYNNYTGKFSNQSTLNQSLIDDNVRGRKSEKRYLEMLRSDILSEKFETLKVAPASKLNILSEIGVIPLEYSGRFLDDEPESDKILRRSMLYICYTYKEDLKFHAIQECISTEAFQREVKDTSSTHVVTGTTWGVYSFVSVECTIDDESSRLQEVEKINEILNKIKISVECDKPKASEELSREVNLMKYTFKIINDISVKRSLTFETAVECLRCVMGMVENTNDSKGYQLVYRIYSLSEMRKSSKASVVGGMHPARKTHVNRFSDNEIEQVVSTFELISVAKQKLNGNNRPGDQKQTTDHSTRVQSFEESIKNLRSGLKQLIDEKRYPDLKKLIDQFNSGIMAEIESYLSSMIGFI